MKAKALGILAEDYTTDKIRSIDELYSGKEIIEDFDDDVIKNFTMHLFMLKQAKLKTKPIASLFQTNIL